MVLSLHLYRCFQAQNALIKYATWKKLQSLPYLINDAIPIFLPRLCSTAQYLCEIAHQMSSQSSVTFSFIGRVSYVRNCLNRYERRETCQRDISSDPPERSMVAIIQRRARRSQPEHLRKKRPMKSKHGSTRTPPNCHKKPKFIQNE